MYNQEYTPSPADDDEEDELEEELHDFDWAILLPVFFLNASWSKRDQERKTGTILASSQFPDLLPPFHFYWCPQQTLNDRLMYERLTPFFRKYINSQHHMREKRIQKQDIWRVKKTAEWSKQVFHLVLQESMLWYRRRGRHNKFLKEWSTNTQLNPILCINLFINLLH